LNPEESEMTSSEKTSWFTPLLIIGILATVFVGLYLFSTDTSTLQQTKARKEFDFSGRPTQPIVYKNQVILPLNEKKIVGKNGLIYRGIEKKMILLDLYILDMDREQAYRKKIPKKAAKKEMILGSSTYRLHSVNGSTLILREMEKSQAR
jgi:hypothetical protein